MAETTKTAMTKSSERPRKSDEKTSIIPEETADMDYSKSADESSENDEGLSAKSEEQEKEHIAAAETSEPQNDDPPQRHENADGETDLRNSHNTETDLRNSHNTKKKIHKLSLTATEDFNAKLRKRGVLYVARIPPRMNPTKMKQLLSDFGEITRIYLVEEDASVRKRRRKNSGCSGGGSKRYIEGWIEFQDKRIAKRVAQSLNNTPISMHKRNVHYGDLWNLKYLHKFQWSHLTEKVAYERRVREQKLKMDMMQARRENAHYMELVETGKKLDKIEARRNKRKEKEETTVTATEAAEPLSKKKRHYRQTKPLEEQGTSTDKAAKHAVLSSLV